MMIDDYGLKGMALHGFGVTLLFLSCRSISEGVECGGHQTEVQFEGKIHWEGGTKAFILKANSRAKNMYILLSDTKSFLNKLLSYNAKCSVVRFHRVTSHINHGGA